MTDVWQCPVAGKQSLVCDELTMFSLCKFCVYHLWTVSSIALSLFPSQFLDKYWTFPSSHPFSFLFSHVGVQLHFLFASSSNLKTLSFLTLGNFHYKTLFVHEVFHIISWSTFLTHEVEKTATATNCKKKNLHEWGFLGLCADVI